MNSVLKGRKMIGRKRGSILFPLMQKMSPTPVLVPAFSGFFFCNNNENRKTYWSNLSNFKSNSSWLVSRIPVIFRNCTLFCSLFSVLLFFLALNPCNRKSGNNEICLEGISYIYEWPKHKLASPSLLTVLTVQFYALFLSMTGIFFKLLCHWIESL